MEVLGIIYFQLNNIYGSHKKASLDQVACNILCYLNLCSSIVEISYDTISAEPVECKPSS